MLNDTEYMNLALEEAAKAMGDGNLPIGALLLIDGEVIGTNRNNQCSNSDYYSHAESLLIGRYAPKIKEASKREARIELFTTLEPCLMCFGTAVHNRINRIVYACPDPLAGVATMSSPTKWYEKKWPEVVGEVQRDRAYDLFTSYMEIHQDIWENALRQFREMNERWKVKER